MSKVTQSMDQYFLGKTVLGAAVAATYAYTRLIAFSQNADRKAKDWQKQNDKLYAQANKTAQALGDAIVESCLSNYSQKELQ